MSFIGKMFASLRGGPIEQYNITKLFNIAYDDSTGILGIAIDPAATVRFFIKGLGATNATYPIYGKDSVNADTFFITDAGDLWLKNNCSALTFTDRTKYPESVEQAYAALASMTGKAGQVDHDKMAPFIKGKDPGTRDLGAVVSCQAVVIKDLIARLGKLEKK